MNFIFALFGTILIEFMIYAIFIRKDFLYLLAYSILINSITNPLMNLTLSFGGNLFVLEFLVFIAEIFLIKSLLKLDYKKSIIISLVANLASLIIGLLIGGFA